MIGRLNHVGVATPSIEASVALYRDLLGATKAHAPFDLPAQGVRVCFEVADILAARDALRAKGATILGTGEPRIGAHGTPIIFVHPKDMGGVLVELMETPKEGAH